MFFILPHESTQNKILTTLYYRFFASTPSWRYIHSNYLLPTWFPSNVNVTELRHKDGNKGPGDMRTFLLWESQLQQLASELLHGAHILYSKIGSPLGPSDIITARSWLAKPESVVRKYTVSLTCNEVDNRILFQHHTPSTQQYELQPATE